MRMIQERERERENIDHTNNRKEYKEKNIAKIQQFPHTKCTETERQGTKLQGKKWKNLNHKSWKL